MVKDENFGSALDNTNTRHELVYYLSVVIMNFKIVFVFRSNHDFKKK